MRSLSREQFQELIRRRRADARRTRKAFVDSAAAGDVIGFGRALSALQQTGQTAAAFRAVGRLQCVPDAIREAFVPTWLMYGDGFRNDANDNRALKAGLRRLLPPYRGEALTLFRGDSAWNRSGRSYGMSWTTSEDVARSFGLGTWRAFDGGSVLLRCQAPAAAILHAVLEDHDHYDEREVLIDPRQVGRIEVVERFSQVDP